MLRLSLFLALIAEASAYTVVDLKNFMFKTIDPIVSPGLFTTHLHSFFGSDAVTASTVNSTQLRAGCTTASNPNDLSTYWVPTLLLIGGATNISISPERFSAYYENLPAAEIPFPENFKARAGKAEATNASELDPLAQIMWFCEGETEEKADRAVFPPTTCKTHLQHLVYFPDCVNPDDITSFGYSGTQNWNGSFKPENRCPMNMKRIPRLRFSIRYDLRAMIPQGWNGAPPLALSSGNSYSSHGDFFFGWDMTAAKNMLLAGPQGDFNFVNGSKGQGDLGQPNCQAKDQDTVDHGGHAKRWASKMLGRKVSG